jgi:hypothetical protein
MNIKKVIKRPEKNKRYERDIADRIWNTYLQKYENRYQMIRDEIGIWHIKCKPKNKNSIYKSDRYNTIQTYSIIKKQLCLVKEFETKNKKTFFKKKLNNHCKIVQEGEWDIVVKFDEKNLDSLSKIFGCYRRRKLSDKQRQELRKRVNKAREIKENKQINN